MNPLMIVGLLLAATPALAEDRLGRVTFDARAGGGVAIVENQSTLRAGRPLLAASLELGIGVSPHSRARLVFAPDFVYTYETFNDPTQPGATGTREVFIIAVPLGFEYDIAIKRRPGLYLYPKILVGYAANVEILSGALSLSGGQTSNTLHQGYFAAAFGLRYAFRNRFEIVFEPVSVPAYISRDHALVLYRAYFGIGFWY